MEDLQSRPQVSRRRPVPDLLAEWKDCEGKASRAPRGERSAAGAPPLDAGPFGRSVVPPYIQAGGA